jgi:hypothetical protein
MRQGWQCAVLCCELCTHLFRRRFASQKGKTRCPQCGKKTSKSSVADQEKKADFLAKSYSKKQQKMASWMNMPAVVAMGGIKADQIPNSLHEALFKSKCAEKGWTVHRPSWPDFLVQTNDGLIAVEVKGPDDVISKTQAATFSLLESIGVAVYIWRNTTDGSARLCRWKPESDRRAA